MGNGKMGNWECGLTFFADYKPLVFILFLQKPCGAAVAPNKMRMRINQRVGAVCDYARNAQSAI